MARTRCAAPLTARRWSPRPAASLPKRRARRSIGRWPNSPASRRRVLSRARRGAGRQEGRSDQRLRTARRRFAAGPPWLGVVRARLASLKGEPAPAEASTGASAAAIPEAQRPMIEGMVERLAARLAGNGGNVDEWSRLIRAYAVRMKPTRPRRRSPTPARRLRPTRMRSRASMRWRTTLASETPIDPPRPPPCADRRRARRRRRGGGPRALCAERQHRLLLQPVRSG